MAITTIHIMDTPGGGVTVLTTAGEPIPGSSCTPAQTLATQVLGTCVLRASDVRYWQGKDRALDLVRQLTDPEDFGHAVTAEVRQRACEVLARDRVAIETAGAA
ncbi:hypothetical protein [Paracidovorax cattleyae]|uniref:hypothetical protein n=1 Tax=Paracidovorax cattleyae TaxID=80868 RepID=UPI0018AF8A2B|nr:hypothetical protein [Paracidovorax cattleyae]MBF9263916.1 hypothetical protein [Paracidovorax cattleyae]UYL85463.1 hypothetical protein gp08c [Acidovorax phage Aval]